MRTLALVSAAALSLAAAQTPAQARDGAVIAAGILGGLALGGLAAAAATPPAPAYPYPYPVYGYQPIYGAAPLHCWHERRRAFDEDGSVFYRRVRVCD